MILAALGILLVASAAPPPPVARDSDEFAYRLGHGDFLLGKLIEDALFADEEVLVQFRRIGVDRACAIFNLPYRAAVKSYSSEFRPLLVGAIRHQVPAEILLGDRPLAWEMAPIQARKVRIIDEIERDGASLLARARDEVRAAFLAEAGNQSAAGSGNGSFADWDLDRPLARRSACMLLRAGPTDHFAARKAPFDGFFRAGDAR